MNLAKEPIVSEEPLPGWLRFETEGEKPWFKTPVPRTVIRDASKLQSFLEKEHHLGRMLDIDGSEFSFKRRFGLRQKPICSVATVSEQSESLAPVAETEPLSIIERLTRNAEIIDHKKLLSRSSQKVDEFRLNDGYQTPDSFEELKRKVSTSTDLRDLLATLNKEIPVVDAFNLMFSDTCLAEISRIDSKIGPLVEFPASINQNLYCKMVEYGMDTCPSLIMFVISMVVRRGEPVLPSDVLKIATLFSSICYVVNKDLDALVKLRSLNLQVDGLSNTGLNILSDMGMAQCARSLSNHRDMFADIGPEVMNTTAALFPYQSTLDNCDFQTEHLTVESVEKEIIDTSDLCTTKKTKEDALALFNKDQVLLGLDQHKEERDHLLKVIAIAAAKVLVEARPQAFKHLAKFLPAHHAHENSEKKLLPAISFILKPYPYQETKNPDTIKLLIRIQRQFLRCVAKSKGDDPSFTQMLIILEDMDALTEEREAAERSVMTAVLVFGEWCGHGDLLTVKMVQEAKMLMIGSATAFGRLEFLGPFRLQLLHMKMKKVSQDYSSCMKREINFDDVLTLPWLAALTRVKVSNKGKEIKKNDSSFERHDQFLAAVQASYFVNLFDNFTEEHPERLAAVHSLDDTVKFVLDMLDSFAIQLFYDPGRKEPDMNEGEDDLYRYCQDMVVRFLLSLAFDSCEEEGDAEGLRALRRIMVSYFLAQKPNRLDSKYASFTLIDLVVELSASQRTRKRMDLYVTINPSGTAGGGLFRDKYEEHCVRAVKGCLRSTHGGLDDIKLEKEVGGLSVITEIIQHNRNSVLRGRVGKEHAKDLVGDEVREQLEENAAKFDPFNRTMQTKFTLLDKSKGGAFKGLTVAILDKFIENKKREYKLKYK